MPINPGKGNWSGHAPATIGVVAALMFSTSGCTTTTTDNQGPPEPPIGTVTTVRSDSEIVLPLDGYLQTLDQQRTVDQAVNILGRDCMKEFGLDWPTSQSTGANPLRNARRYWLTDPKIAQSEGYHLLDVAHQQERIAARKATQPKLSGDEMNIWAGRGETSFHGRPVPTGGCAGEAIRKITKGAPQADPGLAQQLQVDSFARTKADSRVVQVFATWSACMKAQGMSYPDPAAAINDQRWQSEEISDREIAVAVADVNCKVEGNVAGTMLAVETAYQQRSINQHVTELDAIKKYLETEVDSAQRVVATGSG